MWNKLRALRNDVNGVIEKARTAKEIGSSQECEIYLHSNDTETMSLLKRLSGDSDFLAAGKLLLIYI